MQPFRTNVVSQRIPGLLHLGDRRPGKLFERRIALQKLVILRNHAIDLRLLEHHFRHQNMIGIGSFPPGQISPMLLVPFQEALLKTLLLAARKRDGLFDRLFRGA